MRKLILALAVVALSAMPAFASVQNIKVRGSIDNTFLHRDNFDLGRSVGTDRVQDIFFTQTIVGIDADLSDNVSTTVGLINERVWNNDAGSTASGVDLYEAYVTLREMLYSPLTVIVGRQNFKYGNSFIIDSTGTNNSASTASGLDSVAEDFTKQSAMDAFRAILDYNPLKIEVLYSKLSSGSTVPTTTEEGNRDDTDLYGVNASYEVGDDMKTLVEAYFFKKVDRTGKSVSDVHDTVLVPGLRASTNPIEGLNLQAEIALQRGNKVFSSLSDENAIQQRDAKGIQLIANYQVPVLTEYKPVAQYVFTHVSGDSSQPNISQAGRSTLGQVSGETWSAWDPMFENQAGGKVYNSLFSLSGATIHGASLTVTPIEDVTLTGSWTGIWLDKEVQCGSTSGTPVPAVGCTITDYLVHPDGTSGISTTVEDGEDYLGKELDLDAVYNYTEDVSIGANLGIFYPGDVFQGSNASAAKQIMVHANVNF